MRKTKKIGEAAMAGDAIFVFALDFGKFRAPDQESPEERDRANDKVGLHDTKRFGLQVRLVDPLRLERGNFTAGMLDAGKDENGADKCSGDGAEWVEVLREIQATLGCGGIAQLCDKGI